MQRRVRTPGLRAEEVRIARVLLLLDEGFTYSAIEDKLSCTASYISKWKSRFLAEGFAGLYSRHTGRVPKMETAKMEARILKWTNRNPTDGTTHWSTRRLAAKPGIDHMKVARTWKKYHLQPHRTRSYLTSNDPDFEQKAVEVIGLYLHPPQHAAVFCVDEKSAIQALDRKDPILPLSPGRAERHSFEHRQHGTLSLYAAFNTKNGEVFGKTTKRHTSQEFVAFLEDLIIRQPKNKEIYIILNNLSAHKTKKVDEFLAQHTNVQFHFTPTYSSWLNQVENWFSRTERQLIHRGVFTSTKDLAEQIKRFILKYNEVAKPIKWIYENPKNRIKVLSN